MDYQRSGAKQKFLQSSANKGSASKKTLGKVSASKGTPRNANSSSKKSGNISSTSKGSANRRLIGTPNEKQDTVVLSQNATKVIPMPLSLEEILGKEYTSVSKSKSSEKKKVTIPKIMSLKDILGSEYREKRKDCDNTNDTYAKTMVPKPLPIEEILGKEYGSGSKSKSSETKILKRPEIIGLEDILGSEYREKRKGCDNKNEKYAPPAKKALVFSHIPQRKKSLFVRRSKRLVASHDDTVPLINVDDVLLSNCRKNGKGSKPYDFKIPTKISTQFYSNKNGVSSASFVFKQSTPVRVVNKTPVRVVNKTPVRVVNKVKNPSIPKTPRARELCEFEQLEKMCALERNETTEKDLINQLKASIVESKKEFDDFKNKYEAKMSNMTKLLDALAGSKDDKSPTQHKEKKDDTDNEERCENNVTNLNKMNKLSRKNSLVEKENIDLRVQTLKKSVHFLNKSERAEELYNSMRKELPALCTPRSKKEMENTPTGKSKLSRKLQLQCLLLQGTPVTKQLNRF